MSHCSRKKYKSHESERTKYLRPRHDRKSESIYYIGLQRQRMKRHGKLYTRRRSYVCLTWTQTSNLMGGHSRRRQKYGIASSLVFLSLFKPFAALLKCECESQKKKSVVLTEKNKFHTRSGRRGPFYSSCYLSSQLSHFKLFMKHCFFFFLLRVVNFFEADRRIFLSC